jgi:sterol desaturase/sphingolipid hydroxylase (fatty acid hydroxylase superfamily)
MGFVVECKSAILRLYFSVALTFSVSCSPAVFFYYAHRALHSSQWLYHNVHSLHHTFTAPVGTAALFAHPIEYVLSNSLPLILGCAVTGCHTYTMWMWIVVVIASTVSSHCGYAFPFVPFTPSIYHDLHHRYCMTSAARFVPLSLHTKLTADCCCVRSTFRDNYGVMGVADWLHGTMRNPQPQDTVPGSKALGRRTIFW